MNPVPPDQNNERERRSSSTSNHQSNINTTNTFTPLFRSLSTPTPVTSSASGGGSSSRSNTTIQSAFEGSGNLSGPHYRKIFPHYHTTNHHSFGPLIAPNTRLHAQAVMGNSSSSPAESAATRQATTTPDAEAQQNSNPGEAAKRTSPRSNLTALLESTTATTAPPVPSQQQQAEESLLSDQQQQSRTASSASGTETATETGTETGVIVHNTGGSSSSDEADSASGPPPPVQQSALHAAPPSALPSLSSSKDIVRPRSTQRFAFQPISAGHQKRHSFAEGGSQGTVVRRCISSKELGALAPPSGSPYAYMVQQKELMEFRLAERLRKRRESHNNMATEADTTTEASASARQEDGAASTATRRMANETRNQRRAAHNQAVTQDLCEIVTDLFMSENKLINPSRYGVDSSLEREKVLSSVQQFIQVLPPRYALGVDTPSEVLLHMRLMSVVRGDASRAVVHITNIGEDSNWTSPMDPKAPSRRLVTIACADAVGLLEYISKLLATGGSRVLDADVMLSSDNIVLDRFVVEMHGRLRLDKLSNIIEDFLQAKQDVGGTSSSSSGSLGSGSGLAAAMPGSVYFRPAPSTPEMPTPQELRQEMEGAVSLTEALASRSNLSQASLLPPGSTGSTKPLDRFALPADAKAKNAPSIPKSISGSKDGSKNRAAGSPPHITLQKRTKPEDSSEATESMAVKPMSMRERRPLVKRDGKANLDDPVENSPAGSYVDYMIMRDAVGGGVMNRIIPLIPFEEIMLIETLGRGRVSTIYRAAWKHKVEIDPSHQERIQMLALKVAMVDSATSDTAHVDELRREADIAARLSHPNVCDLVGVAADPECFCLAYDFCEGGSLLSLLTDPRRYYEYLPIALDIANGMAYLHSRSLIHRDLKPSNILLTRDHRAKIADFGMSVANTGQELTAETGTYRYMAPEVIRHESYSSNADVYSFGICLWQLITREIPFATMTPIQAAYAVAEGNRPTIPASTPRPLREIIEACWDQDSRRRPSFTYVAMSLAEYAKVAFSPANVGAQTLQIANEMLANVEGNSTVNVDFTTPVTTIGTPRREMLSEMTLSSSVGLEI